MHTRKGTVCAGLIALLVVGGALGLGACSSAGGQPLTTGTPAATLHCLFAELPQPSTKSFTGSITCQVSGATSADTAFILTYSANGVVCRGTLVRGSGSCDVSFPITPGFSPGTVAGELLPSHHPLGPVKPSIAP